MIAMNVRHLYVHSKIGADMPTISIRDLGRRPSQVIDEVVRTGRPAIVTRHGRPVTALVALDPDELEDYVLAHAPEFVRATRAADADLRAGRARTADEVFAELEQD
jgi:prevent-host-death family protein